MIREFKDHSLLLDIIHNNVLKSEAEFGLIIKPEDVEIEKSVILSVFNKYKFKKWNEYSNDEYMKTFREVYNKISDQLEDQLKYYFYNTPEGKTKTRYNCHLESVISDLFRLVINNEAVKWYKKGKLTIDTNFVSPPEKEFDDFITDNEFREFLIYNFCYDDYVASCEPGFKRDFKNNDREQYIDNAFSWDDSTHNSRGSRFWSNLDTKWNKKIGAYDDDMDEAVKWYNKGKLTLDPNIDYNVPDYIDFITDDKFRDFLIKNGAYDEFIKYCHQKYKDNFNNVLKNSKLDIIDNCLHWSDTPSGDGFWGDLNNKWNRNRY